MVDDVVSQEDYEDIDAMKDMQEHINRIRREDDVEADESVEQPEPLNAALLKYQIMAEVCKAQENFFDSNVAFFGTHVVNSNTKRVDNLRHLDEMDLSADYKDIPYMRERSNEIRLKTTSEYQMCRSNSEIGGFDRKMQYTNIRRDEVDVKQQQSILKTGKKRTGILGLFSRKKEGA